MTRKYIISYLDNLIITDRELSEETKKVLVEVIKIIKKAKTKEQIEDAVKLLAALLEIASKFFK